MQPSPELTRFFADHATPDSRNAFLAILGTAPTPTTIAAAISAKGYRISEAELVNAIAGKMPLEDPAVTGTFSANVALYEAASKSSGQFHAEFVNQLSAGAASYSASNC